MPAISRSWPKEETTAAACFYIRRLAVLRVSDTQKNLVQGSLISTFPLRFHERIIFFQRGRPFFETYNLFDTRSYLIVHFGIDSLSFGYRRNFYGKFEK